MKKSKIFSTMALALSLTVLSPTLIKAKADEVKLPDINGKTALTMDLSTGEIIYAKSADEKMYPASTTKLMTAILLAENKQKNDTLNYTESAKKQPEYSLNTNIHPMQIGETMSANDVMKALLLFSANDCAYMVADNVGGNVDSFIKMMNDKATKLNLKNTHFVTANGLHDPEHYTTAYDLSVLGKTAYENPWVKEVMGTKKDTIKTSAGTVIIVENRNKILGKDGCVGGKTGYTTPAGKCLVAIFERSGRPMVGVVMKSIYDQNDTFVFNDMEKIINWSYEAKKVPFIKKDTKVETLNAKYKLFKFFGPEKTIEVPLMVKEDVEYYENEINKKETTTKVKAENINPWKLQANAKAGTLTVSERNYSKSYDLYTTVSKNDIVKANTLTYILSGVISIAVIALIIFVLAMISKASKRKRRRY